MAADRGVGWKVLRDAGRVVSIDGIFYLTHREDVLAALRDPELFSSKKAFDVLGSPLPLVPISFDPPEHTRFRKILQPFFSPHTLKEMLPSLQQQAIEIIGRVADKGECEVVADVAIPYPSQVFLTLFGLPLEDRDKLVAWKTAVIAISEAPSLDDADLTPALELVAYLTEAINARRADPGPDILSQLLNGEEPLGDAEIMGLSFLFVLAGLDTVTAAMSSALLELARNPGAEGHPPPRSRSDRCVRRGDRPAGAAGADAAPRDHHRGHHRGRHAARRHHGAVVCRCHQSRRQRRDLDQ